MVSEQEMEAVLGDAGRFAGLGDGRRTGFERFEIYRNLLNWRGLLEIGFVL